MPTKSPKGRKPKAPTKAEAAKAELKPEVKTYEWRGLTLELPAKPPGALFFAEEAAGPAQQIKGLLKAFVGPDQYAAIQAKISEDGLSLQDTFEEMANLADGLTEMYGLGSGESEASQDS